MNSARVAGGVPPMPLQKRDPPQSHGLAKPPRARMGFPAPGWIPEHT
ncbi:hypothetical protein L195_g038582, partial [Trifolium pratense]